MRRHLTTNPISMKVRKTILVIICNLKDQPLSIRDYIAKEYFSEIKLMMTNRSE